MDNLDLARIRAPFETDRLFVRPEWIDYNGHMNVAYYIKAFDEAFDELYVIMGVDGAAIRRTGISTFTAEMHITYQREVKEGDHLRITTQLIDFDAKRMHFIQCMYHADDRLSGGDRRVAHHVRRPQSTKSNRIPGTAARLSRGDEARPRGVALPPESGRRISLTSGRPR